MSPASQNEKMPSVESESAPPLFAWIGQLLLAGVIVGAGLAFYLSGVPAMILLLAASTLCGAIWLMWSSLQRIGESDAMGFEEALSFAAPSATEEQKRAVLRALKDLEYERHVGKISEEDFILVSAEYRQKAKELIAEQDDKMAAQIASAEKRVARYLTQNQSQTASKSASKAAPPGDALSETAPSDVASPEREVNAEDEK